MKIKHTSKITSNKHFYSISPKERFSDNIDLSLCLIGQNIQRNFESGFIDLHYKLMNGKIEINRVFLSKEDIGNLYQLKINTGDLLIKIRIGLYFIRKTSGQYFNINLDDAPESENSNFITVPLLKDMITKDEKVQFLEKMRLMAPENFLTLLNKDLVPLKALMEKASEKVFYFWVLADTIVKMAAMSKIPISYLDRAVEEYYNDYNDGKLALGLNT